MQYISKLVLDISGEDLHQCITAKQGDDKTRLVEITLMDGENQVKLANGESADFRCLKPDNRSVILDATYQTDGAILLKLDKQVLAVAGTVLCDVAITDTNENLLSTANFYILVEPAATNGGYIPSEDYFKRKSNIDMNGFRIRNLPTPENDDEATNKAYVDNKALLLNEKTEKLKNDVYSYFSNVLKGDITGKYIRLNDVSPIEHMVKVTKNGLNSGSAKVIRYGKNLWLGRDSKSVIQGSNVEFTGYMSYYFATDLPAGITYTFTADITSTDTDAETCMFRIGYTDGTGEIMGYLSRANRSVISFTPKKDVQYITLYAGSTSANGSGDTATFKNIQLEVGSVSTDFEEYKDAEIYESTAKTIKSVSPTMTLFTDLSTAKLTCKYNKDINRVIDTLIQAILSLGGNV